MYTSNLYCRLIVVVTFDIFIVKDCNQLIRLPSTLNNVLLECDINLPKTVSSVLSAIYLQQQHIKIEIMIHNVFVPSWAVLKWSKLLSFKSDDLSSIPDEVCLHFLHSKNCLKLTKFCEKSPGISVTRWRDNLINIWPVRVVQNSPKSEKLQW